MGKRCLRILAVVLVAGLVLADNEYAAVQRKLDQIEQGRLRAGTRIVMTSQELSGWAAQQVPEGVRNPKVELGAGTAIGSALIDFAKVRRAQGKAPGWVMGKLLEGERPVKVTVRIQSAKGMATVDVERVEVAGLQIEGQMLDFLIQNFLLPMYPDAAVGRPFEIGSRIDRLEIAPGAASVIIGK